VSIADPARALLAHEAARGLAKRLWGALPRGCQVGLPRRLGPTGLGPWLRRDDLLVELVRVPQDGIQRAVLLLSRSDAARMVDHLLGGDGQIGRVLELSEAETGVLAYALGRALLELELPYQLADVRSARDEAAPSVGPDTLVWPHLLETELGAIDVRLLLAGATANTLAARYELQLVLRDRLPASELAVLEPGDLLVSDRWALIPTARGLEGALEVRVAGSAERLGAQLSQGALHVVGLSPEPLEPEGVELIIARPSASLAELADIVAGQPWVAVAPSDPVELRRGAERIATGSLVVHRGALGLRVAQSMR
jgi:hypothetical protein